MDDTRKIKDIYGCTAIVSDVGLYPLQNWYNRLIDKTIAEVNAADVLRMMRQNMLTELAILRAAELLKEDVFAGEAYDGELLEKISEADSSLLASYADELKTIIKDALTQSAMHEWSYDGEEDEFEKAVSAIAKKLPQ